MLGKIIIGEIIGIIILVILFWRSENVTRTKVTKGKRKAQNKVPLSFPYMRYDSCGYRMPNELETQVEGDDVEIKKIKDTSTDKKKLESVRTKGNAKTGNGIHKNTL